MAAPTDPQPPTPPPTDPQYWRERAEEARIRAAETQDQDIKDAWLRIVEGHERQAELLRRLRERPAHRSSDH